MAADEASHRLDLRGFSVDRSRFLLSVARAGAHSNGVAASSSPPRVLERSFVDLQTWDRFLHRNGTNFQRLPTRRLRKLMVTNWVRGDQAAGWRIEYRKTVKVCEAWLNSAFARLPKQQQLEFLDDALYTVAKTKQAAMRSENKHARDLQQYFTTLPLVDRVLGLILQHLGEQKDVAWLEPSCGDGRFLTALLRAGARHVVGYEIDECVHAIAAHKMQEVVATRDTKSLQAEVCLGDFLTSKRSFVPTEKVLVAVGNPPFGARDGDGSDLVHSFFRHAAHEWKAAVIAFIVPERCARPGFIDTTLLHLNGDGDDKAWMLAMEQSLADFQFEFGTGGKLKRVRQPSVLQIFSRQRCVQ
ncbi:hypothetical protein PHYBOEH_007877 [Phytophthora boehmeriae]|uniref:Uncharacterized protein n=1 Tax=Phytophthora boehmeriae TaxID=109152 RepID=A0A8T1W417_9STRA|nr:hypothetical protein PHYBOEH_007877 [Phytophthora boehmeriae]